MKDQPLQIENSDLNKFSNNKKVSRQQKTT